MNKHLPLVLLRLAIAYGVAQVLAFARTRGGNPHPVDGQHPLGPVVTLLLIGLGVAVVYFTIASLLHLARRDHSWLGIFATDLFLGALFAGLLAYAGATASNSGPATSNAPSDPASASTDHR